MTPALIMIVVGGAAYLLLRRNPDGSTLIDQLLNPVLGPNAPVLPSSRIVPVDLSSGVAMPAPIESQNLTAKLIGSGVAIGAPLAASALAGGTTAGATAGGSAGAAGAAGGISTAAALTAAGVAAGAAVLAWAIIAKGLFRGGEEALKVNPARDAWFQHFVDAYFPGAGSERQFDAYVLASGAAGVPGDVAERLLSAVYAADTVDEFEAATAEVTQQFEYYASRQVG